MAMTDIRDLNDEELVHQVVFQERELVTARFRHSMNQLENTAELGKLRRGIAQLLTETRGREKAQGLPKGALLERYRKTAVIAPAEEGAEEAEKGGFLKGIVDRIGSNE